METPNPSKDVEAIWDALAKTFSNWCGVRPKGTWFRSGLSERMGWQRLRRMENGKEARTYFELTKNCSLDELFYLSMRAKVNLEQAMFASRITLILHVTSLIGLFVLTNQIFPGELAAIINSLNSSEPSEFAITLTSMFIGFVLLATAVASYAIGGVAMARDLKHLTELSLARRKMSVPEDENGEALNAITQLEESYLG